MEKGTATHCSILTWRISWREELGGLQSAELQRVRHDWTQYSSIIFINSSSFQGSAKGTQALELWCPGSRLTQTPTFYMSSVQLSQSQRQQWPRYQHQYCFPWLMCRSNHPFGLRGQNLWRQNCTFCLVFPHYKNLECSVFSRNDSQSLPLVSAWEGHVARPCALEPEECNYWWDLFSPLIPVMVFVVVSLWRGKIL